VLNDDLDPGIRYLVGLLRSWSYMTTDSGDGVTKLSLYASPEEAFKDGVRDYPHVSCLGTEEDAKALLTLFEDIGVKAVPVGSVEPGVQIQFSADMFSGIGVIDVMGLNDRSLDTFRAASLLGVKEADFAFSVSVLGPPWDCYRITMNGKAGVIAFRKRASEEPDTNTPKWEIGFLRSGDFTEDQVRDMIRDRTAAF